MSNLRGIKISDKQKTALIEQVQQLPMLVSGKFNASFSQRDAEREWRKISAILNSMGGAAKEWKMWRKTWQDLRSRTKAKISTNKMRANKTGGGVSEEEQLSNIEEDILNIIKTVSVEGHNVQESSTVFDFEEGATEKDMPTPEEEIPVSKNIALPSTSKSMDTFDIISTNDFPLQPPVITNRKKIPKKIQNLVNVATAATSFKENLQLKTDIKERYYKRKLEISEEMLKLKQRKVAALENIGNVLADIANNIK